jgi:hypothetical protein
MWFLFGLVSTLGFALYVGYRRLIEPWSGDACGPADAPAECMITKHKSRITRVRIGVTAPDLHDFTLRRQTALDAFFVRLGLSHEQTVGDVVFDDSMYLLSDDARLGLRLRGDAQLREALFGLLDDTGDAPAQVKRVRCVGGRLWVDCKPTGAFHEGSVSALTLRAAPKLRQVAARLATRPPVGAPRGDHSLLKAVVLLGISSGLAINGALQLARLGFVSWPILLDRGGLLSLAISVGLVISALLLVLTVVLLRGSSRAHGVALELLLTGTLGGIASGYSELYDYNVEADRAPALAVQAPLVERRAYGCGKRNRSTCYRVTVQSPELPEQTFKVDRDTYARLAGASNVMLAIHPGELGFRWLEGLDRAD